MVGFLRIANKTGSPRNGITLLTRDQQLADRHLIKHWPEQVQQRRFQRRLPIPSVRRSTPFAGVEIRRLIAFVHLLHHAIESGDLAPPPAGFAASASGSG